MILRKLKIIDRDGNLDYLMFLFFASVISVFAIPFSLFIALAVSGIATYRDEILRSEITEQEKIMQRMQALEDDLNHVKLQQGIRTLK